MTRLISTFKSLSHVIRCLIFLQIAITVVYGRRLQYSIDYDALERAWEKDDSPEELKTLDEEHYDEITKVPESEAKLIGPQMIFVTLHSKVTKTKSLADIASLWKELLWTDSVDVNVYEIEDQKILIGLQNGRRLHDVKKFIATQADLVKEYQVNDKTFVVGNKKSKSKKRKRAKMANYRNKEL